MKEVFSPIYAKKVWGKGSGPGSDPTETIPYRGFLQSFLHWNEIQSVVDLGCGDWQFSQFIDWRGIDYVGVDVVPAVVKANQQNFGNDHVKFELLEGPIAEIPPADLLIVKDVLQHWGTPAIRRWLAVVPRYPFVLVTNCVEPEEDVNIVIKDGDFRPVDLRRKPFYQETTVVFAYPSHGGTKEVHLIRGRSASS